MKNKQSMVQTDEQGSEWYQNSVLRLPLCLTGWEILQQKRVYNDMSVEHNWNIAPLEHLT